MIDTELLRRICRVLILEKDSERLQELLLLLCALVDNDEEEVELKLQELSKRYASLDTRRRPDEKTNGKDKNNNLGNREGI